ncbi:hypothetical protein [Streptomyces graminofaciens]|uniref:hypothetical protein n=1 Tax=Streptomyces graminofaciens TaxID=68212 RepID=UPI00257347EA|nr:hypothetical protein [Streptomyces graminofaciens]
MRRALLKSRSLIESSTSQAVTMMRHSQWTEHSVRLAFSIPATAFPMSPLSQLSRDRPTSAPVRHPGSINSVWMFSRILGDVGMNSTLWSHSCDHEEVGPNDESGM